MNVENVLDKLGFIMFLVRVLEIETNIEDLFSLGVQTQPLTYKSSHYFTQWKSHL